MAVVTYDDRSYSLDGKRIWLVSGSIHYFRVPEALWSDRLLKARRAGLNCVSTLAPWNLHEPREGQWDFSGDQDIVRFVKLAGEHGLYVIVKPGPYVGGEWDGGGLPSWLSGKSGTAYRTSNASYSHYFDKYFRQLLARLADLQVTRGGNIVLIQNECEYTATTMPDRLAYLEFVSQLYRRSGFDIPIITGNLFSDPPVPDSVECASGWAHIVHRLKQLRRRQPKAPMMASPFWCGAPDSWGRVHERRDDLQAARTALEIIGCGAQLDYTMWHGGTNFGFGGARSSRAESWYATTSYDYDAPLAEGGGLTHKYYLTRLVNMLAGSMGSTFAACAADAPGVTIHDATQVYNLSGPMGRWAIVSAGGRSDIRTVRLSTPSGTELTASLDPLGAVAIPVDLALTSELKLDYANVMPLCYFGGKILVFHGPPDWAAAVSINGTVLHATVPHGDELMTAQFQGLTLVFVNSDLAMRTWSLSDSLVFGPEFVGSTIDEVAPPPQAKQYTVLPLEGELVKKPSGARAHKAPAIKLGPWKRAGVCAEPTDKELPWQRIDRPQDMDRLGAGQGYLWYQIEINREEPAKPGLFLPECEDRATVYVNGALLGVWGRGSGATREPLAASFRRGANVMTVLADNLGRFSDEPNLGQLRGLFGHVYGATPLPLDGAKRKPFDGFSRRMIPRGLAHLAAELESQPVWSMDIPLSLSKVAPVHLSFADVGHHVAVLCNDRQARLFARPWAGANFGDLTLGSELKKGKNLLKLLMWGEVSLDVLKKFRLHLLGENLSQGAAWSFRRWTTPQPGGRVVGKDMPAWYVSHFKYAPREEGLFLHIIGAKKGQVFLNGHNVGRFWTVGPQEHYYLPSCWLKEENELMVFEEQGLIPAGSAVEFRRLGPYHKE